MSEKSPRVLILAENCNPLWPSLPIVGFKYALALAEATDAVVVTHVRNRPAIEDDGRLTSVRYIDNEWIASPMHRLSTWLRGGDQVAWSVQQMMSYLPYLEFERRALAAFRDDIRDGRFDIVHRVTPMTPTRPSYVAGRTGRVPFVIGPLNGNLDWPAAFRAEQRREKELLRRLRNAYRTLPFARSTFRRADAILSSFEHTTRDLVFADPARIVSMPEIGFDPELFFAGDRAAPFSGAGPFEFLYAGRLVPYKLPEAVVAAFVGSEALANHHLRILGDGPERPRLEAIVDEARARDRVTFEGTVDQAAVATAMRKADAFVFPSIRELGAGVVIEAMASGVLAIVADYGAPGELAGQGRGITLPLRPLDEITRDLRAAMESCLDRPDEMAARARAGQSYATQSFTWPAKAAFTLEVYDALLTGKPLSGLDDYA